MAELSSVARPYAKAAFEYAVQHNQLKEWLLVLSNLAEAVKNSAMAAYLKAPGLSSAEQVSALEKIVGTLTPPVKNFLSLLAQKNRLLALPAVQQLFEQLLADYEKTAEVNIRSAFALSDQQTQVLASGLRKRLGKEVHITTQVDRTLIGGVFIQAGDLVIDASVRGKLNKLATQLNS